RLAINGVRDEKAVEEQLNQLRKLTEVIYCQGNIGDLNDHARIIEGAGEAFEGIDVLVNNAGVAPKVRKDILELDEAGYDYLMDINLKGTFFLTQAVGRLMVKRKQSNSDNVGCIINITSMSAEVASVNRAEYCMSK